MFNGSKINTFRFNPFLPEHLGGVWEEGFGKWEIKNGSLCHILPDDSGGNVETIIADTPDAESFNRIGTVKYCFSEGGFDSVHVRMEVSLQCMDGFSVGLDDDAVEWTPYFGMKPVLTDIASGSRGHEYSDIAWPACNEVNCIEVIGDQKRVIFRFNERELFSVQRKTLRMFRQLTIDSYAGAVIKHVQIDGKGLAPTASTSVSEKKQKLTAVVDFADDLCYSKFNAEMIDQLLDRLMKLGISRVYWMNTIRVRPEALGDDADAELNRNLDQWDLRLANKADGALSGPPSIRSCYPFLPKAVEAAHRRGMELYGVLKMFDLGWTSPRGVPSPYINDHFRQTHPEAMMKRCMESEESDLPVDTIHLFKDDSREHSVKPENISIWVSDDNLSYKRIDLPLKIEFSIQPKRFRNYWEGDFDTERDVQVITISGLNITAKYFAVVIDGSRLGTFCNRIYRLCEVLDREGREISATRNLPERPRVGSKPWTGAGGFVFKGYTTCRQQTGNWRGLDWIEMFQMLDGNDLGIAFMRGKEEYVDGAPNPAHPATQKFWLDWVTETLDAGVDGIDFRIMSHNNILDWANYGFGSLVETEFEKRFNKPLGQDATCRRQHVEMLGEMYTEFLRKASQIVRKRGKKMQHHVSRPMDCESNQRPMINIHWNWRRWIEEGLLDSITLKDIVLSSDFGDEVITAANACGVEALHCPYLCCMFDSSPSWEIQLRDMLRYASEVGTDGFMMYEVASFLHGNENGEIILLYPELTDIL